MSRLVFPGLFRAAAAPIVAGGETRVALRWILHTSVGMRSALQSVHFQGGRVPVQGLGGERAGRHGRAVLSWTLGPGRRYSSS
jgi:hypothetical protein